MSRPKLTELIAYLHQEKCDRRYPFMLFGVECGKGWDGILQPVYDYIHWWNEEHIDEGERIYITQVKEKYGTLRVYCNHETQTLSDVIRKAEGDSCVICEICGSTDDVGMTEGWNTTICHKCLVDEVSKSKYKQEAWWRRNSDEKLYIVRGDGSDELVPEEDDEEEEKTQS
ncbi:MAG: hypothetical protein LUD72_07395 [Bacteroidales bacterium]|nr:hypothetical protein [Bacteroidales bacterium]